MITANRLHSVQEYYFSKKLREVRGLINQGKPIINMGIGSPDLAPSPQVLETLKEADRSFFEAEPRRFFKVLDLENQTG